jgi:hypothetical protein
VDECKPLPAVSFHFSRLSPLTFFCGDVNPPDMADPADPLMVA